ncbi:MAG TPA: flagellar hook-length control protein FliK [Phycisphaerales bacterium]|nr:flagellar hook-length control protein FliK [Phycisphaerales bacterium]
MRAPTAPPAHPIPFSERTARPRERAPGPEGGFALGLSAPARPPNPSHALAQAPPDSRAEPGADALDQPCAETPGPESAPCEPGTTSPAADEPPRNFGPLAALSAQPLTIHALNAVLLAGPRPGPDLATQAPVTDSTRAGEPPSSTRAGQPALRQDQARPRPISHGSAPPAQPLRPEPAPGPSPARPDADPMPTAPHPETADPGPGPAGEPPRVTAPHPAAASPALAHGSGGGAAPPGPGGAVTARSAVGPVVGAAPPGRLALPAGMRAAPTAAPPRPAPSANTFAAALSRGVSAALAQRDGTVTLRLQPAHLGHLRIQVGLTAGTLSASFHASSPAARDLLDQSLHALRAGLEAKGLAVDRLDVQVIPERAPAELGEIPAAEPEPDPRTGHPGDGRGAPHREPQREHTGSERSVSRALPMAESAAGWTEVSAETASFLGIDMVA